LYNVSVHVCADAHYNVHKEEAGARTVSLLQPLEGEESTKEIAVMLAGPRYTEVSLPDARGVMHRAQTWKQEHGQGS
jgi:DNA repair ATPase RecN